MGAPAGSCHSVSHTRDFTEGLAVGGTTCRHTGGPLQVGKAEGGTGLLPDAKQGLTVLALPLLIKAFSQFII